MNIEAKFMVSGLNNQYKKLFETIDKNPDETELIVNQLEQIDITVQNIRSQIISDLEDYMNYGLNQELNK
jgi:hypothetical protein